MSIGVNDLHSLPDPLLSCFSLLLRRVETADSANEVLVGMGTSSGVVCVWKVVLAEGRLVQSRPQLPPPPHCLCF